MSFQPQWSNGNASGAVQSLDLDSDDGKLAGQESNGDAEEKDAIRDGKRRAQETMAAAGVAQPSASPAPDAHANARNATPQPNGTAKLGRKRSRDGTQLPISQSTGESSDPTASNQMHNEVLLDRYIQRDMMHCVAMNDQSERSRALIDLKRREKDFQLQDVTARRRADPASIYGYGFAGYGNGTTNAKSLFVYPSDRGPPKSRRSKEVRISRKDNTQQSEQHEELVPVRLDIELDKLRLRDTFTWNLHEKTISQDVFTQHLLEDLKIPLENLPEISRQVKLEMQDQILNFYPHLIVEDSGLEYGREFTDFKDEEMRIQIKLNITIGRITLVDQFEWDINNPLNSPEEFARQMAFENALSGEFTTAIAHSIREQSQLYTKSLFLTNHSFDGRLVEDPDVRDAFLPGPIHSAFRPPQAQKDFTPYMYEMSEAELERTETSMMREHRAQKRQLNRRGGPALPDLKDRQRTVRSLIVHSVIPGAVETFETTGILKTRRGGRARRAARTEGDADSDELDSEESGADSPAPSIIAGAGTGTTRTRNMRGAATAAQAAMRALGRSGTPDSQLLQTPDVRTSGRRSMLREENLADVDDTLVVTLKISRQKYKHWWENYQAKKRAKEYPLSGYASQPPPAATPARGGPTTPALTPKSLPQSRNTPQPNGGQSSASAARKPAMHYDARGGVDMETWPGSDDTPPDIPPWLHTAMNTLRTRHPDDDFIATMKPYILDANDAVVLRATIQPGEAAPPGQKLQYLPRIRCQDCPGKVYTALPGRVIEDFEVHLRNRAHQERAVARREGRR